jgi:hypothetical protein
MISSSARLGLWWALVLRMEAAAEEPGMVKAA